MIDLNIKPFTLCLCISALFGVSTVYADLPQSRINPTAQVRAIPGIVYVNITGTVIAPPPCIINDGNLIEVNFGEVMSSRIDGTAYKKDVLYTVQCNKMPASAKNAMKMSVQGNKASFDSQSLSTNIDGLGIAIHYNNSKLPVGRTINFIYPNAPQFAVVPVRDLTANLKGGYFESIATLLIEYQ
ncbi:fimbrial protein [Providencia manganoxydans]|uniref:fimbrial protein n=1 Tax=Providencia manganoxydans TaxID=2923283 RepID=UPI0034DD4993